MNERCNLSLLVPPLLETLNNGCDHPKIVSPRDIDYYVRLLRKLDEQLCVLERSYDGVYRTYMRRVRGCADKSSVLERRMGVDECVEDGG